MTQENKKIVHMIVVDADGEIITAANGRVSSDNPELVRIVKEQAAIGMEIQFIQPFGDYFRASLDPENPIGITAALFSAKPGRTRLLEAPQGVWDWLKAESSAGTCGHTVDPDGEDFESMSWEDMELATARELFGDLEEGTPSGRQ
jgi:hypothetical protein